MASMTNLCRLCGDDLDSHQHAYDMANIDDDDFEGGQINELVWVQHLKEGWVCGVCYQNMQSNEMLLLRCGHAFCEECLKAYVMFQVTNGKVQKLVCPDQKC